MKLKKLHTGKLLSIYVPDTSTELQLPLIENGINAGFPSPANDFLDGAIDLNKHLIKNPSATFIAVTNGNSMQGAGIYDRDLLIIDKSLQPSNNDIAVCIIDGEFTLKRLKVEKKAIYLIPENDEFEPIKVTEDNDFSIWGILTFSIKQHKY